MMDNRTKNFIEKFESASKYLKADRGEIVSLKFRDSPFRHGNLFLGEFMGILKPIKGEFQGKGFITEEGSIFVEHETGLEILYVVGSIASITGFVLYLIDRRRPPMHKIELEVERRYFGSGGNLIEEKIKLSELDNHLKKEITAPYEMKIKELEKRIKELEG